LHAILSHITLSNTIFSRTTLPRTALAHAPFTFPLLPSHLHLSFATYWKKMTCGVIQSFNCCLSVEQHHPLGPTQGPHWLSACEWFLRRQREWTTIGAFWTKGAGRVLAGKLPTSAMLDWRRRNTIGDIDQENTDRQPNNEQQHLWATAWISTPHWEKSVPPFTDPCIQSLILIRYYYYSLLVPNLYFVKTCQNHINPGQNGWSIRRVAPEKSPK